MRGRTIIIIGAIAAIASVSLLAMNGHADRRRGINRGMIGPDVIAWTIGGQNGFDFEYYGSSEGIGGYSMATQSCNWGDEVLDWYGGTNQSPIIMQNMYRLKDGRFEQIGMQAFMKHSFCALSEPGCGSCQSTNCDTLGIGCADTYWAGLNSGGECPRSDVNGFTGEYPYPFSMNPTGPSAIRGNLQILNSDVDPAQNAGARYFLEAQYVAADDMQFGNGNNNASWREVVFNSISDADPISTGPSATINSQSAIQAWRNYDSSVRLSTTAVPDEGGKVVVGVKVFDNGDGTYDYEYAVYNMNSDRSIREITIPTGNAIVSNLGFHDVPYNSGEIYDGTDWASSSASGQVSWSTQIYSQNQNANAIRWGTMYNFRFTATTAPEISSIELGIFKPGGAASYSVSTMIPSGNSNDPCDLPLGSCPEDVDGNGIVAVADLLAVIGDFGDCGDGTYRPAGDVDGDCCVTVSDILTVVSAWGNNCTPAGACCLISGSCDITSAAACAELSGTYHGDDSNCAQANCPQPAACCFDDGSCATIIATVCADSGGAYQGSGTNCKTTDCPIAGTGDECSSAMIASYGANAFETNSATPSDNPPDDSQCSGTYLDWGNSADIWFYWHSHESESVRFLTCDGSSYDTSMALYKGSCDNQVACNGDADWGLSGCQDYYSAIEYDVEAGESYYIRIGGWKGSTGSGNLTIE